MRASAFSNSAVSAEGGCLARRLRARVKRSVASSRSPRWYAANPASVSLRARMADTAPGADHAVAMALTVAGPPQVGGAADWCISGRVPMVFRAGARYNWGVDEDEMLAATADLRDLLRDIPEWRLAAEDWPKVRAALRAASAAAGAGDAARPPLSWLSRRCLSTRSRRSMTAHRRRAAGYTCARSGRRAPRWG